MQSPTGERPPLPVSCCGAFQASETHFVYDEACQTWKCRLKEAVALPEPPVEPRPVSPAAKPAPKPRAPRTARKKS
jgi:hypothetical protein